MKVGGLEKLNKVNDSSTWTKQKVPRGKNHNKTATKTTVSLYLAKKTVERARFHNLNLSRISEQALISILDYLEPQNNKSSDILGEASFQKKVKWWAGPDLNRRPSARQADVLTELDDRPYRHFRMVFWYLSFSFFRS